MIVFFLLYMVEFALVFIAFNFLNCLASVILGTLSLIIGGVLIYLSIKTRKRYGRIKGDYNVLITEGPYSIVRHPEYTGHVSIIIGLMLLSQSIISFIIGSLLIISLYLAMIMEEKELINKFESSYLQYIKTTPRCNIITGLLRKIRKRS